MKKVIFVLALSGLVSFGSYATCNTVAGKSDTEITKGGGKKKKKSSKKESCSKEKSNCCEKKTEEKKTEEQPK
jgi:hypothetical protein